MMRTTDHIEMDKITVLVNTHCQQKGVGILLLLLLLLLLIINLYISRAIPLWATYEAQSTVHVQTTIRTEQTTYSIKTEHTKTPATSKQNKN